MIDASVEAVRKKKARREELAIREVVVAMVSVRVAGVVTRRTRKITAMSMQREQVEEGPGNIQRAEGRVGQITNWCVCSSLLT